MKKEDVLKQYTTPIAAPAFVQGPHRFRRREYLNITYRTDREALARLVPEPLEIDQPLVRFEVMKMPDTTGYDRTFKRSIWYKARKLRLSGEYPAKGWLRPSVF